jgi:hypothetical protein
MSESNPPHDAKTARLKSIATIVASLAALVTALGAYFKPTDHSVTKSSYEELTSVLKGISDQVDKDHEDLTELRGYVEGVIAGKSIPATVVQPVAGALPATSASVAKPAVSMTPTVIIQAPSRPAATVAKAPPVGFDTVMQRASSKK